MKRVIAIAQLLRQDWAVGVTMTGGKGTYMIRAIVSVVIVTGLLSGASAHAQAKTQVEARYSGEYNRCMASGDAANGVTSGIMDCNGTEIDRQDARLNQVYKMVMTRLNSQQKTVLQTSERNWIGQRDARCRQASAPEEGGTAAMIIYSSCVLDETVKRTMWLENYKN